MLNRISKWGCQAASGAVLALMFFSTAAAQAQTQPVADVPGRIDFEAANLPPATVEVELGQSMISDLLGIGDAAVAGVTESLLQAADANSQAEGTRMAAEKLEAARQVMQLASQLVHEVRVRVYEGAPSDSFAAEKLSTLFDAQLKEGNWEKVVRVRDGDDSVQVSLVRSEGALRGALVVVGDGNDVVLANVVCDISPENVKKLTTAATKIGLENGLQQVIEQKVRHLR